LILANGNRFVSYDLAKNRVLLQGDFSAYFPDISADIIGITYNGGGLHLVMTGKNSLQVYDPKKYIVLQEYPLSIKQFVACMSS